MDHHGALWGGSWRRNAGWSESVRRRRTWGFDEEKAGLAKELADEEEEGLYIVPIGLGRDVVVLKKMLMMLSWSDLPLHFQVHLATYQHRGDGISNAQNFSSPLAHILEGDPRSEVERDNGCLRLNVVCVTKTPQLLLPSAIPYSEFHRTFARVELEWCHIHPCRCLIGLTSHSTRCATSPAPTLAKLPLF